MADVDHPKTHVEDQDIDLPRKQPESPHREGIDPLTESDTMYPAENTKNKSEALARKEDKLAQESLENDDTSDADQRSADLVTDQQALDKGNDNAEVTADKTDKETGTENTSSSNKTTSTTSQADVKAAETKTSSTASKR